VPAGQTWQLEDRITEQVPLKRFVHSGEIAAAGLYRAPDDSAFLVGTELAVDGGMTEL